LLKSQVDILGTGIHHYAFAKGAGITRGESYRNSGDEGHLEFRKKPVEHMK
jgi:hypothetical protein